MPAPPYFPRPGTGGNTGKSGRPGYKHASEILRGGGFPAYAIRTGVAVMGGESSYNPKAGNYCCHGLMQVNVLVWAGKLGIPADRDQAIKWLEDPDNNAKAAYGIFKAAGNKWTPWEAFTTGAYRTHLGQDPLIKVDTDTAIGDITDTIGDVVTAPFDAVGEVAGAAVHVLTALLNPSTWLRLGKGALGGTLLVVGTGVLVYIAANKASGGAVGAVAGQLPTGKVAKVAGKAGKVAYGGKGAF